VINLSRDMVFGLIVGGCLAFVIGAVIGYAGGLRDGRSGRV